MFRKERFCDLVRSEQQKILVLTQLASSRAKLTTTGSISLPIPVVLVEQCRLLTFVIA